MATRTHVHGEPVQMDEEEPAQQEHDEAFVRRRISVKRSPEDPAEEEPKRPRSLEQLTKEDLFEVLEIDANLEEIIDPAVDEWPQEMIRDGSTIRYH